MSHKNNAALNQISGRLHISDIDNPNVVICAVCKKKLGIESEELRLRREKVKGRLRERYGEKILRDMEELYNTPRKIISTGGISLKAVAEKYNMTKMNASLIFKKLYGITYQKRQRQL